MQCPHCKIGLRIEGDQLVCSCGYHRPTPYKKIPSQYILYRKFKEIGETIKGEGTPAEKLADITFIIRDC